MFSSGSAKGNVLRRPSVTRGSPGVGPAGTAEPNPTAPAGRVKSRINNGGTGHLCLRTKQRLDRNTNGFSVLTASTFPPRTGWVFQRRLAVILRGAVTSSFKQSPQLKACARISSPFEKRQTSISPRCHWISPCHCSHFSTEAELTHYCQARSSLGVASSSWTFWRTRAAWALFCRTWREHWESEGSSVRRPFNPTAEPRR